MGNKGFYNKFEALPLEAQEQVLSFIDFLQKKYVMKGKKSSEKKSTLNKKFIGLWENREDMKDSSDWIRNLREKEWGDFEQ